MLEQVVNELVVEREGEHPLGVLEAAHQRFAERVKAARKGA